ncbi:MAG TPA: Nramp family divalent metal transporter [Rhizomicrobium sp.]|nr:Nramp family divalent metal transporter [Rhizomicrobium sp.]
MASPVADVAFKPDSALAADRGEVPGLWPLIKYLKSAGPGLLVAVGYMDPGNWATDIAGGSRTGYTLLSVVFISSLAAMFLQYLALKLGLASGRNLAEVIAGNTRRSVRTALWIISEVGMIACSLAELLGAMLAIQLLFGFPEPVAVLLSGANMLLLLKLEKHVRKLEAVVGTMVLLTALCLAMEFAWSSPSSAAIVSGVTKVPHLNRETLYLAAGILGATVMPHNLYLQSALMAPEHGNRSINKCSVLRVEMIGTVLPLCLAALVNAALLILAAAIFHHQAPGEVVDLSQAYKLLPLSFGTRFAGVLFGIALWLSSQGAAITSAMAGRIVLEGFNTVKISPVRARSISRTLAVVPALLVSCLCGRGGTNALLIFSQVILSVQLLFVALPLLRLTGDADLMKGLANKVLTRIIGWGIIGTIFASDMALASIAGR